MYTDSEYYSSCRWDSLSVSGGHNAHLMHDDRSGADPEAQMTGPAADKEGCRLFLQMDKLATERLWMVHRVKPLTQSNDLFNHSLPSTTNIHTILLARPGTFIVGPSSLPFLSTAVSILSLSGLP